jgi:hypothetical protein
MMHIECTLKGQSSAGFSVADGIYYAAARPARLTACLSNEGITIYAQ